MEAKLEYTSPHLALRDLVSSNNVTVLESPLPSPDGLVPFKRIPQIRVETRESIVEKTRPQDHIRPRKALNKLKNMPT